MREVVFYSRNVVGTERCFNLGTTKESLGELINITDICDGDYYLIWDEIDNSPNNFALVSGISRVNVTENPGITMLAARNILELGSFKMFQMFFGEDIVNNFLERYQMEVKLSA